MNAVFVDTGGWMACADCADPVHVACIAARDATVEAGRVLITTDFVVDETQTPDSISNSGSQPRLLDGSRSTAAPGCDGSVSRTIVSNGRGTSFSSVAIKDLSFTDCASIAVMRELRLTTVITTDRHFHQVGFVVLPATRPRRVRKPRRP
jgi:uncharacterized protein